MGGGDGSVAAYDSESNNAGTSVTLHIRCSNGSKFSVQVSLDSTVGSFRSILAQNCDIPAEQQRLIYKGRILKDDQSLESYGLEPDHTVHLVRGFPPAASANTTGGTNTGGPNTLPSAARDVGSDETGGLGRSDFGPPLFPGLGSNRLGSGGGSLFPDFEQMQQNPNMMRDIMDMPLVQNLMSNPDVMRSMIMNNRRMREIMDRNPELAHMLNDPATLRQTLEAARNPELMREMMRNTDRAMSNIESSPEGFNMLRRMYENVQEPMLNAATTAGDNRNDVSSNPFAALLGSQGGGAGRDQLTSTGPNGSETTAPAPNTNPLPNPWASAGAGTQTNTTTRSNPAEQQARTPPPLGGLGGLGFPGFGGTLSSTPDPNSINQVAQNPIVSQIMQSLLSNPEYMNQILGLNPHVRNMLDSNPQPREMMRNPQFIRQLTSPETIQQLLSLPQSLQPLLGRQQSGEPPGQNIGGTGAFDNNGLETLMNMFGLGIRGLNAPNQSNVPPEELYATQLAQLQEMGFFDAQENIRALTAAAGNVHAAVERLLGNPGP